jgi:hypothetical protein
MIICEPMKILKENGTWDCCVTPLTLSHKMLKIVTSMLHTQLSTKKHVRRHCLPRDGCNVTLRVHKKNDHPVHDVLLRTIIKLDLSCI